LDWHIAATIGVFLLSVMAIVQTSSAKFLTIREHNEFMASIRKEVDILRQQVNVLEQTRPTTGELKAYLRKAID
jgi:altronate dehydratase